MKMDVTVDVQEGIVQVHVSIEEGSGYSSARPTVGHLDAALDGARKTVVEILKAKS